MSSASSAVTYTCVYTDSEPGRVFWGADVVMSNGGFVHEDEDEHVFLAEEQPLPPVVSPMLSHQDMLLTVMSSASYAVTYTSVYTDSEPGRVFWGADEELSNGGSPRVIVYGYGGLPMQPVAPPSPDYIPDLEEPHKPPVPQDEDEREHMFIHPHDPDYVPEPIYPKYIPLEDEHVFPVKEQPLPPVDSPTAESLGYVSESDPEEDPE
ncbi:hypothetical protein Tco_0200422 [Tanacetum coccineum]